jgi:hypothetical protein
MTKIAEIIAFYISEYGIDPYEINNGSCEEFADDVIDALESDGITGAEMSGTPTFELPGHYWVDYNGKSYDAECPDGVDNWRKLPIFQKFFAFQREKKQSPAN